MVYPELSFCSWRELFLRTRGLDVPDGRSLHQYKLDDAEFENLRSFLTEEAERVHATTCLSWLESRPCFPDLFVLFAAEWWRRSYQGHGFIWDPIIDAIHAPASSWTTNERSRCVRTGLKAWGLSSLSNAGFKYLGAIAVQGGIPLALIAEARGKLSYVITRTLQLAAGSQVALTDIENWIESLEGYLPRSYRQREITTLLSELAWSLINLKAQLKLDATGDPIGTLDRDLPGWREKLPIRIDDQKANRLIENLVREAANTRPLRTRNVFAVARTVEAGTESETWNLHSRVDLPEYVPTEEMAKFFGLDSNDLPYTGELELVVDDEVQTTRIRKVTGRDAYHLTRTPWGISGTQAQKEHRIRLKTSDGRSWTRDVPGGSSLERGLPWLLESNGASFSIIGQGNLRTSQERAVIALHPEWNCVTEDQGKELIDIGEIAEPNRLITVFSCDGIVVDPQGNRFRVKTRSAEHRTTFEWRGDRMWLDFSSPDMVFRGEPQLFSVDDNGTQRSVSGEIRSTAIGTNGKAASVGPVIRTYSAGGELRCRTRMVILPTEAEIEIDPINAQGGSVTFTEWGLSNCRVVTDGVDSQFRQILDAGELKLECKGETRTPDDIDLELYWKTSPAPVRLKLPYPAKGIRVFLPGDREIESGASLAVQRLAGARVVATGCSVARMEIRCADRDLSRTFPLRTTVESPKLEIRLSDYRADIEHLLTIDDNPDSTVLIKIETGSGSRFSLCITPHEARTIRRDDYLEVEGVAIPEDAIALALPLNIPESEPCPLSKFVGEDGQVRGWSFRESDMSPGPWLIYPPLGSGLSFRPTMRVVRPEELETSTRYSQVACVTGREERVRSLEEFVGELSQDFADEGWRCVDDLWRKVGHLPLATLDIWRVFAGSSAAMAALAFRFSQMPVEFLDRFAEELPFSWEIVNFSDWRRALRNCRRQCVELFPTDEQELVFTTFLTSRINAITSSQGGLFFLLNILRSPFDTDARQTTMALRANGAMAAHELFNGANSLLQRLRRAHASDGEVWPNDLRQEVNEARRNSAFKKLLCHESFPHADSVINAPLLVGAQICRSRSEHWFKNAPGVHALRTAKGFDIDWFEGALGLTVLRCLADGDLDDDA